MATSSAAINADQFLDPVWRLNNLYSIIDKDGRAVRFHPNWAQQEFLENFHKRNIILKARQLGFTTLCCLIYLDDCIFNPNIEAAVIAHKLPDAQKIFKTKVKYPYEHLDEGLKAAVPLVRDSADSLSFNNGSTIQVTTSTRSGTVQWLHISEYGKICAQFPDKAQEIRTGAFPSVPASGVITIESTAEGQEGDFFDKCETARSKANQGVELSPMDFRFNFFPWWREPTYKLENAHVVESPDDIEYFSRIEAEAHTTLEREQRDWWLSQEETLGGDMKREYPATAKEAFEQALEGAYFADQLASAEKHHRITRIAIDPRAPVNTFWDLGMNDHNTIWLHQFDGEHNNFIGFYKNSGEFVGHYITWLNKWAADMGVTFGKHYWPHDGDRKSLWLEGSTLDVAAGLGFRPEIVQRTKSKIESIQRARGKFGSCSFDKVACAEGIKDLKAYRKEWDDKRGVWRDKPRHDEASHTADGFLTFVESKAAPTGPKKTGRKRHRPTSGQGWMAA